MANVSFISFSILTVWLLNMVLATSVADQEWTEYKAKYKKDYSDSRLKEFYAKYCYSYNKKLIDDHNNQYDAGAKTYKLAINQFTDLPLRTFIEFFPMAAWTEPSSNSTPPAVQTVPASYDPINNLGFKLKIEDQGTNCNSGWAYSAAKAIELFHAQHTKNTSPLPLSAQNLIDCAGRRGACIKQVPQSAFDYLIKHKMDLYLESDYKNNNKLKEQGMCVPNGQLVTNLRAYSRLEDGDEESLKAYVANGFPVVVEFNPTSFEFMHYSKGIFQQPPNNHKGSHFMLVIGYGTDENTSLDYWLLQNSFGTTWGEMGLIKLYRIRNPIVIKNAIFPIELV